MNRATVTNEGIGEVPGGMPEITFARIVLIPGQHWRVVNGVYSLAVALFTLDTWPVLAPAQAG